jgi:hypothetical protein
MAPVFEYFRFVTTEVHPDSHCQLGIIRSASRLQRSGRLLDSENRELEMLLRWFDCYMPVPRRFSHYSLKRRRRHIAISWLKPEASQTISRMMALANFLNRFDVTVYEVRTSIPGYITYEDEQQLVAVPFRETNMRSQPFSLNRRALWSGAGVVARVR